LQVLVPFKVKNKLSGAGAIGKSKEQRTHQSAQPRNAQIQ
jgi:hypothetical protein